MAHTEHRPSLRWTVAGPLSADARDVLAEVLECSFTDENAERAVTFIAPDTTIVVVPAPGSTAIVAHFDPGDWPVRTQETWLHEWVVRACAQACLADPVGPAEVVTGPAA
jgi:hypothetical protein